MCHPCPRTPVTLDSGPNTPPTTVTAAKPALAPPPGHHHDLVLGDLGFIKLPEGRGIIGSPDDEPGRSPDERQQLFSLFDPLFILTTEVLQSQYELRMHENPSHLKQPLLPVTNVAWDDAMRFCELLSSEIPEYMFRLPTEHEWEYAARAGIKTPFSVTPDKQNHLLTAIGKHAAGDHDFLVRFLKSYAVFGDSKPHPLGKRLPNAWGLHDMHGNVWEWCDGVGHTDPDHRVIRGGAFTSTDVWGVRSAVRGEEFHDTRKDSIGFRIVAIPK